MGSKAGWRVRAFRGLKIQTATVTMTAASLIQFNAIKSMGEDFMNLHHTLCTILLPYLCPALLLPFSIQATDSYCHPLSHSVTEQHFNILQYSQLYISSNSSFPSTDTACPVAMTCTSCHPLLDTHRSCHMVILDPVYVFHLFLISALVLNSTYLFLCTSTATSQYLHFHLRHAIISPKRAQHNILRIITSQTEKVTASQIKEERTRK